MNEEGVSRLKVEIARKDISNIKAIVADIARRLPLADRSVDPDPLADVQHDLVA